MIFMRALKFKIHLIKNFTKRVGTYFISLYNSWDFFKLHFQKKRKPNFQNKRKLNFQKSWVVQMVRGKLSILEVNENKFVIHLTR